MGIDRRANRPEGGARYLRDRGPGLQYALSPRIHLIFTDVPNSLPNFNVLVPPSQLGLTACPKGTASATNPGSCSYTALMNSGLLNNNNYWSTHYDGLNGYSVHDQITGFTLDGAYDAGLGCFDKLLFGVGYSHREKNRDGHQQRLDQRLRPVRHLVSRRRAVPVQCSPYSFGSQGFNVISMVSLPNFMQGAGGSYPTTLPQLNVGQLLAFLKSLNGKPNPFYLPSTPRPVPCVPPFSILRRPCRRPIPTIPTMSRRRHSRYTAK